SLIGPLFATPLVLADRVAGDGRWCTELYYTLVFALGPVALYGLLRRRVDGPLLRRFLLVLVAGSMFAAHVVHWNSEVFTAMTVAVGLTAVAVRCLAGAGWVNGAGWVAVVLGVANTPASVVGLALVTGKRMVERRRVRYALVLLAALGLVATENSLRNGNPLNAGYGNDRARPTGMP